MTKKEFLNIFNDYKQGIILAILPIILTLIIDSPIYFIKELLSNYIIIFILFLLFSYVLFIFNEKKIITILWIFFFIALFFHSLYIYKYINKHSKTSSINFYGLYSNEKEGFTKTNNDKLLDENILKSIDKEEFFNIENLYLPNHILYFFEKEEIIKLYENKNKNNVFSLLIYKEDNIYKIVNFLNDEALTSPYHTKKHFDLIKNTFNEILNLNSINKEEVISDLLLMYQQEFLRMLSYDLLYDKVYDYKKIYELYNLSTNNVLTILYKYKRLISNSDLIKKIDLLLDMEQSISKHTLALINISSQDYNSAIKNLIACLQLTPYFPYDNYEEFIKDFKAYYHVSLKKSLEKLKSKPEYSYILEKDEDFKLEDNLYTDKLSSNYLEINPPYLMIKELISEDKLNNETYILIENRFNEILELNNIFKFYFADIIKYLPKGTGKINDMYLDRVDESKALLENFMKLDSNMNDIISQKLIALYLFKQTYEEKEYHKEIMELLKQNDLNRLKNGPTP